MGKHSPRPSWMKRKLLLQCLLVDVCLEITAVIKCHSSGEKWILCRDPTTWKSWLSPCCTITQVYTFIVGWISFERLDMDKDVDMDKNGITDGPRSSLHFIKQPNTKREGVTLRWLVTFPHPCSFNAFLGWSWEWWVMDTAKCGMKSTDPFYY